MGLVTQSELAERYNLKLPFLSQLMKEEGIKQIGYKEGMVKRLAAYDDQEVTAAIIKHFNGLMKREREKFNEAKAVYTRVMEYARESGILREIK